MAEALGNPLRVNTFLNQQRHTGVTKVIEAETRQPMFSQIVWKQRRNRIRTSGYEPVPAKLD